jgi:hypothetical protein
MVGVERGYIAQNPLVLNFIPGRYPSKKKSWQAFQKTKCSLAFDTL